MYTTSFMESTATFITVLALVCFATFQHGAVGSRQLQHPPSRLHIEAKLPVDGLGRQPNTFIALSDQMNSSLLSSGTPVLLWGAVPATVIRQACNALVRKGKTSFDAYLQGTNERFLDLQVEGTRGCHAAADESGTEFVFVDDEGRQSTVICPNGAGDTGCGVYVTGEDVTELYHQGIRRSNGTKESEFVMDGISECVDGAGSGAVSGAVTGVLSTGGCWDLGPVAPFCAVGVIGTGSMVGAIAGCVRNQACFPGSAMVELVNGEFIPVNQLRLGHKVAVLRNGMKAFEDVYAFGHRDKDVMSEFLQIHMISGNTSKMTLEISQGHFIPFPVHDEGGIRYKRAMDVEVGDILLAFSDGEASRMKLYKVTMISVVKREGLYNPLTLGGTIIVNGVVASTHSDWFLDPLFNQLGIAHLLPQAYQLLLLPARCIYSLLGPPIYSAVYEWLDRKIDIAETGTKYGSEIVVATATIFFVAVAAPKLSIY